MTWCYNRVLNTFKVLLLWFPLFRTDLNSHFYSLDTHQQNSQSCKVTVFTTPCIEVTPSFFLLCCIFFTQLDFWGLTVGDAGGIFLGPRVQRWLDHSWVSFLIQEVCVCVCKKAGWGCGPGLLCTWYERLHWCHVVNDSSSVQWEFSCDVQMVGHHQSENFWGIFMPCSIINDINKWTGWY